MPLPVLPARAARRIGLAVLLTLFATDGLQNASAQGETRTLRIHHSHTKEDITVTFKRNGRFDDEALKRLNHFLRDWRNNDVTTMDRRLFDILWEVYQEVGGEQPIVIISAYRSPQTNAMLRRRSRGVAKHSQHILGHAIDFNIPGVPLERLRHAGLRLQRGGVGYYPSSGSPFVHMDVGSVRHWPRMAPDAYARVMRERPMFAKRPSTTTVAALDTNTQQQQSGTRPWYRRFIPGSDPVAETAPAERTAPVGRSRTPEAPRNAVVASAPPMPPRPNRSAVTARLTPAQVVEERGLWGATATMAALEAKGTKDNPRMQWQVGAQPVNKGESTVVTKRTPAPRPRPELVVAAADATASVPWPTGSREDRVPREIALSYAAEPALTPQRPAAPMGALQRPAPRPAAAAPQKSRARNAGKPMTPPTGRLAENPWLRGIILADSVHFSMDVTILGRQSATTLAPMMHKPRSAIANTFAEDPSFGLESTAFGGAAVAFVPMVTFGTFHAAALN